MAYTTQSKVLERLSHVGATTPGLQARIDDAILAATATIDHDCDRVFTQDDGGVKWFTADRYTNDLVVPDYRAITTVEVDDADTGTDLTAITNYEMYSLSDQSGWPYERIRLADRTWPQPGKRRYRIKITANWGWEAVPAPIDQACSLLASRIAQRASSALFGVQSFGELGAAPIRSADPDYLSLIGPYRRPRAL